MALSGGKGDYLVFILIFAGTGHLKKREVWPVYTKASLLN
jgi:hypothetical protein